MSGGFKNVKKQKKLISKLLMLTMCTTLVATTVSIPGITNIIYASASTTNSSSFEFDSSTGTITKYVGIDTAVTIPAKINGVQVKCIGPNAFYSKGLKVTSISIPNSVTSVGKNAFSYCESLPSSIKNDIIARFGKEVFGG